MATPPDPNALLARLSTLSDLARLRMLRLVEREELSVGELARALQLPQSTVSRHLKLLKGGDWVVMRSAGTASLYRMITADLDEQARTLWIYARDQLDGVPTLRADDDRLAEVLAERPGDSRAFFGRLGGEWDHLRTELFGRDFTPGALLGLLPPHWVVADLGCGTGDGAACIAPFVTRVIAVDREPAMLAAARKRLRGRRNVEFRQGDLTDLPIDDASVNAATILLVLHHLESPVAAIREAARILGPGGLLAIVDMVAHDRETYRHTMGHQHLGFDEATVQRWATDAGLVHHRYERLRPDTHAGGPGLFVATMGR